MPASGPCGSRRRSPTRSRPRRCYAAGQSFPSQAAHTASRRGSNQSRRRATAARPIQARSAERRRRTRTYRVRDLARGPARGIRRSAGLTAITSPSASRTVRGAVVRSSPPAAPLLAPSERSNRGSRDRGGGAEGDRPTPRSTSASRRSSAARRCPRRRPTRRRPSGPRRPGPRPEARRPRRSHDRNALIEPTTEPAQGGDRSKDQASEGSGRRAIVDPPPPWRSGPRRPRKRRRPDRARRLGRSATASPKPEKPEASDKPATLDGAGEGRRGHHRAGSVDRRERPPGSPRARRRKRRRRGGRGRGGASRLGRGRRRGRRDEARQLRPPPPSATTPRPTPTLRPVDAASASRRRRGSRGGSGSRTAAAQERVRHRSRRRG